MNAEHRDAVMRAVRAAVDSATPEQRPFVIRELRDCVWAYEHSTRIEKTRAGLGAWLERYEAEHGLRARLAGRLSYRTITDYDAASWDVPVQVGDVQFVVAGDMCAGLVHVTAENCTYVEAWSSNDSPWEASEYWVEKAATRLAGAVDDESAKTFLVRFGEVLARAMIAPDPGAYLGSAPLDKSVAYKRSPERRKLCRLM